MEKQSDSMSDQEKAEMESRDNLIQALAIFLWIFRCPK